MAELCHYAANQCSAARVPLQINRSMNVTSTVYFGPAMRTARLLVPDLDETEFFLQLRIAHDLVPQRSGPGRDHLNDCLHFQLTDNVSAGNWSFCNACLAGSARMPGAPGAML